MEDTYIVLINYKGYINSHEISLREGESLEDYLKRKKIHGGIEEIWEPGSWEYDPETLCPRRIGD